MPRSGLNMKLHDEQHHALGVTCSSVQCSCPALLSSGPLHLQHACNGSPLLLRWAETHSLFCAASTHLAF